MLPAMFAALRQDQVHYHMVFIPLDRVYQDEPIDSTPIAADSAYCRLWLREMQLLSQHGWFHNFYPVVQASTRFIYGGQAITVPCLAGPGPLLAKLTQNNLDHVMGFNYPLTPLFPFRGGDIDVQAGLFRMTASDPLKRFVSAIERIANLLPIPEFSTVLKLVQPTYDAIADLMGVAESSLQMGYQDCFVSAGGGGANQLRGGYFAAIQDEQGAVDPNELCVVDGHLRIVTRGNQSQAKPDSQPLEQCSYMLFYVERRSTQNWGMLGTIDKLVREAQKVDSFGSPAEVRACVDRLANAVMESNDLLPNAQDEVYRRLKGILDRRSLQAVQPEGVLSLASMMNIESVPALDEETEAELANVRELRRKLNEGA